MDDDPTHVTAGLTDLEHVVVLSTFDDHADRFAGGGQAGCLGESLASSRRQHRQAGAHGLDPRLVRHERHEVGLEEVPVVVGVLLVAQRVRPAVALVPVAGLLPHRLTTLDDEDLPLRLVVDGAAERSDRVHVLDLAAGAEVAARPPDADVGVDAHRALLHLGVGRPDRQQDRAQLGHVLPRLFGRTDVRTADDLDQRHPGAVEVDQRVLGPVDAPLAAADVRRLAGVLLDVGALDADRRAVGQVEVAVDVEGVLVLTDLIRGGHVGVEVVLACERARLHRAVQRQADAHRQLDRVPVEHRQCAGQPQRHGVDVRVRLVTEPVRRRSEQLGARRQLDVDLEAHDHLVAVVRPGHVAARFTRRRTRRLCCASMLAAPHVAITARLRPLRDVRARRPPAT